MSNSTPIMLAEGENKDTVSENARKIVTNWLKEFEEAVNEKNAEKLQRLFVTDGWLKDDVTFSWDMRALNGASKISQYILQDGHGIEALRVSANIHFQPTLKEMGPMSWLESGIDFETTIGAGRGIIRLANTAIGEWKGWIMFTALEQLKGHPRNSIKDGSRSHEQRNARLDADKSAPPAVVVIGGSSSGLAIAACLQEVGIKTVVIERSKRIGDAWRNRYKRLELHSPGYGDSRPMFDMPTNWPTYPTKDQHAAYLEFYASIMELDIWTETEFISADFDDESGQWTVKTKGTADGGLERVLHPHHVIWAGSVFIRPVKPNFAGIGEFTGKLYHAAEHDDAANLPMIQDKKVVVIGSNTTAHDICQDFAEAGADVTMIQRSSTVVCSPKSAQMFAMPPPPTGQSNEDYIWSMRSFPTFVLLGIMEQLSQMMIQTDSQLLQSLEKTEFVAVKGEDRGDTFLKRGLLTRGGFYIDHGASGLIAANKIKVMHCPGGVERIIPQGLVLEDGRIAEADIIVLATGWHQIEEELSALIGEKEAARAHKVNKAPAIDEEGQSPGFFRPTGHPSFWITGGNLLATSMNSLALALQIQAREIGLTEA